MAASHRVGFIGLGIMGLGMARNLAKKGCNMVVWNRTVSVSEEFAKAVGCTVAQSPREVIETCSITYSILSTPEVARSIFFGQNGVEAGISAGKSYVDCATLNPRDMTAFSEAVTNKGGRFLEAPVSGSKGPAAQGTLIFMTAGSKTLFDEVKTDLEAMGKASYYLGETVGAASKMKLVVNMVMGGMMTSIAEGLCLAEKCDLPTADLLAILGLGAVASPMLSLKGPKMTSDTKDFAPAFPLKHAQKDMQLAIQLGLENDQALPISVVSNEVYKRALADGLGDNDFCAVIQALRTSA